MGAITSAVIAIAAVVLGWITIEVACKPCLDQGRQAIDRSLNPDYDPDDIQAPLNPSAAATTNVPVHGDDNDNDNDDTKSKVSSSTQVA